MSLLNNFDIDKHFWREYPQFKVLSPFKDLYKEDKSRDHANSSQKMWAIAFLCDPSKNNPYRNLSKEDRRVMLSKDWIKNTEYDWSELEDCISFYNKNLLTSEQKSLLTWKNKMEEFDEFIKNTSITVDNGKTLIELLSKIPSLYTQLKSLEDKVENSENDGKDDKKIKSFLDEL